MNYYSKIFQLLSEEHWTGKQKKEREKSKRSQQWRTWPLDPKDPSKGTLQVQKAQHQEVVDPRWFKHIGSAVKLGAGRKVKRVRVTKPVPSWMGMKGKMVHHTTSQPKSGEVRGRGETYDAPRSVKRHTTVTAKIPGGEQVRNRRFPTSHDSDD